MNEVGLRVNAPEVIHESIDGEVIVINLTSGVYYSLKGSAAEVWAIIASSPGVSEDSLTATVAPTYGVPRSEIEGSVESFVMELQAEGLVARTPESVVDVPATLDNGSSRAFVRPTFEKYTDMQDLMLLDPVHQVDATGWPQASADAVGNTAA